MKPNIVFILADDMGQWAMGCSGNDEIITPQLDQLAKDGVMFNNFFCASPVCSPARASILTGTIPSEHGVHDYISHGNIEGEKRKGKFVAPKKYIEHLTSYTQLLQQEGYNCALSGKWHLGDSINPQSGFSNWYSIGRGGCSYFNPDVVHEGKIENKSEYITDLITKNAIENIEDFSKKDEPFYLSVHFTAPHSPWGENDHKKQDWDLYENTKFTSTPKQPYHPLLTFSAKSAKGKGREKILRGYYSAITAMDRSIGEIIKSLKENSVYDDTVIIFTADNGMNMGHHGLYGKGNATYPQNLLDTSVKIPFIISYPKKIAKSIQNSNLFSHYDIMPTLIELLDLKGEVKQNLPGKSFAGILNGENKTENGSIIIMGEYGMSKMIRTKDYKLIVRDKGFYDEFYDLTKDKNENNNLIKDREYKPIIKKLDKELKEFIEKYSSELYRCDGIKNTGVGQAYAFDVEKSNNSFVNIVGYKNYLKAYCHRFKYKNYKV